jgi:hypothetical protein
MNFRNLTYASLAGLSMASSGVSIAADHKASPAQDVLNIRTSQEFKYVCEMLHDVRFKQAEEGGKDLTPYIRGATQKEYKTPPVQAGCNLMDAALERDRKADQATGDRYNAAVKELESRYHQNLDTVAVFVDKKDKLWQKKTSEEAASARRLDTEYEAIFKATFPNGVSIRLNAIPAAKTIS